MQVTSQVGLRACHLNWGDGRPVRTGEPNNEPWLFIITVIPTHTASRRHCSHVRPSSCGVELSCTQLHLRELTVDRERHQQARKSCQRARPRAALGSRAVAQSRHKGVMRQRPTLMQAQRTKSVVAEPLSHHHH
jgi:hypothetical protein